ncbi:MAG: hypothetical protein ACP5P7_06750, partial [Sulfurihydrogenibium sp.]
DLYLALLNEKGLYQYFYDKKLMPSPKLQDIINRIKSREYYNDKTLQNMLWHLNLATLKLQAKIFLHKKKIEEMKKRYEKLKDLGKKVDFEDFSNVHIEKVNEFAKLINSPLRLNPNDVKVSKGTDGTITYSSHNGYEVEKTNRLDCLPDALRYYEFGNLDFFKSERVINEDNYKKKLFYGAEVVKADYYYDSYDYFFEDGKYYSYSEGYNYDEISYRILKSLLYSKHFIRRVAIFDKYIIIFFDSGFKTYIYFSDKKVYATFYSYTNDKKNTFLQTLIHSGACYKDCSGLRVLTTYKNFNLSSSVYKYIYLSFNISGNYVYLSISRTFSKSDNIDNYSGVETGVCIGKRKDTDYIKQDLNNYNYVYQYISLSFDLSKKDFSYSPSVYSYIQSSIYDYVKNDYIQQDKLDIPIEIINTLKPNTIDNPFNLSSYRLKSSVLNPLNPDNPKPETYQGFSNRISIKDFVKEYTMKDIPIAIENIKIAFVKEVLTEFKSLIKENNETLESIKDYLDYYYPTLALPSTVAKKLVYATYETLRNLKRKGYLIEGFDF